MSFGLVLSGGGVRGSAHIGVLKALHEEKLYPTMVSGTSAGSIVAGLYAYGYTPDEIFLCGKRITKDFFDVDYSTVVCSLLSYLFHNTLGITGLIKGDVLENYLYHVTKGAKLNAAKIPVAITAVDINNTHIVVFTSSLTRLQQRDNYIYKRGKYTFAEAIRASIAIPGIFKPKIVDKMRLVDGGIRANLPVEIVREMGARKVIAVNLGYSGYPVPGVDDILEISLQAIDLMVYQITRPSIESADLIISPQINNVRYNDLQKIDHICNCGYLATKKAMPHIKELLGRY